MQKRKIFPAVLITAVAVSLVTASQSSAAILAGWETTGTSGTAGPLAPATLDPAVSSGTLSTGPFLVGQGDADRYYVSYPGNSQWQYSNSALFSTINNALTNSSYIPFSITTAPGQSLSLSSITLKLAISNPEAQQAFVSNLTGYDSANLLDVTGDNDDIVQPTLPSWQGGSTYTLDLSSRTELQNIPGGTAVEFRIVNFNVSNGYLFYGIGQGPGADILIEGSVSAVPEPTSAAALLLAGAGLVRRLRVV
jgi:hypothetical protein